MTDSNAPDKQKRQPLRVFDAWAIRKTITDELALVSAERAFKALARDEVTVPPPMEAQFEEVNGEVQVKGAHLHNSAVFVFKVATGFYNNVQFGVPTGSGMVLVFDAETGFPICILADNGYLTDLRTAAAGALAVKHLAPDKPLRLAMVGAGIQAQLQLRLIKTVRNVAEVRVCSRSRQSRDRYAKHMSEELLLPVQAVDSVAEAVDSADLVVTATPARSPVVLREQLAPGVTVLAVGSDGHNKQELDPKILADADKVVTDLTSQCITLGELHHAVEAGLMSADAVYAELGKVVNGEIPGRENDDEMIICDLTGVGAQDAAIAEVAVRALARPKPESASGVGADSPPGP
jgi:ornithine cyclodeaminase/alanine dehydrogenase-like protein (mu-crystallin family)